MINVILFNKSIFSITDIKAWLQSRAIHPISTYESTYFYRIRITEPIEARFRVPSNGVQFITVLLPLSNLVNRNLLIPIQNPTRSFDNSKIDFVFLSLFPIKDVVQYIELNEDKTVKVLKQNNSNVILELTFEIIPMYKDEKNKIIIHIIKVEQYLLENNIILRNMNMVNYKKLEIELKKLGYKLDFNGPMLKNKYYNLIDVINENKKLSIYLNPFVYKT